MVLRKLQLNTKPTANTYSLETQICRHERVLALSFPSPTSSSKSTKKRRLRSSFLDDTAISGDNAKAAISAVAAAILVAGLINPYRIFSIAHTVMDIGKSSQFANDLETFAFRIFAERGQNILFHKTFGGFPRAYPGDKPLTTCLSVIFTMVSLCFLLFLPCRLTVLCRFSTHKDNRRDLSGYSRPCPSYPRRGKIR